MKKQWLFSGVVILASVMMLYIGFRLPLLNDINGEEIIKGESLYQGLETFMENELTEIIENLKKFNPIYLINVSGYLLVLTIPVAIIASCLNSALMERRLLIVSVLNVFVMIVTLLLFVLGIYACIVIGTSDGAIVSVNSFGYVYYLGAVFILLGLFLPLIPKKYRP